MSRSTDFFQRMVEPTGRDFLETKGDQRMGCFAAIVLNQMADYWAHDGHAPSASNLRDQLRIECPPFALIADVADATKHAELDRRNRSLTSAEQISSPPGAFTSPWGSGVFREAWVVGVTLDDRTTLSLPAAVQAVLVMWRDKLNTAK